jgi:hypothetical protein
MPSRGAAKGAKGPGAAGAAGAQGAVVNAAGLVQGIALVTFPAASTILTSRSSYDLSGTQYGVMFVPQMTTAILASLLGADLLWPTPATRSATGSRRSESAR